MEDWDFPTFESGVGTARAESRSEVHPILTSGDPSAQLAPRKLHIVYLYTTLHK